MDKKKYVGSFLLGAIAGALIFGAVTRTFPWCKKGYGPRKMNSERILSHLDRKLDLADAQKEQIKNVIESNRAKLQALHEETWPKFRAIHSEFKSDVRPLLNPDQQSKFDEIVERFDQRMEKCATKYKD